MTDTLPTILTHPAHYRPGGLFSQAKRDRDQTPRGLSSSFILPGRVVEYEGERYAIDSSGIHCEGRVGGWWATAYRLETNPPAERWMQAPTVESIYAAGLAWQGFDGCRAVIHHRHRKEPVLLHGVRFYQDPDQVDEQEQEHLDRVAATVEANRKRREKELGREQKTRQAVPEAKQPAQPTLFDGGMG